MPSMIRSTASTTVSGFRGIGDTGLGGDGDDHGDGDRVDGSNTSAEQTLPPLERRLADGAVPVAVSGAFRDRDNDTLTYGASSSDPLVATASVSGLEVSVTSMSRDTLSTRRRRTNRWRRWRCRARRCG